VALARREVGAKNNETAAFHPLLEPLGMPDDVVAFDALHSLKEPSTRADAREEGPSVAAVKGFICESEEYH
jgi:hypothetical protein